MSGHDYLDHHRDLLRLLGHLHDRHEPAMVSLEEKVKSLLSRWDEEDDRDLAMGDNPDPTIRTAELRQVIAEAAGEREALVGRIETKAEQRSALARLYEDHGDHRRATTQRRLARETRALLDETDQ